jgi:hypothetical protein
MRKIISPRWSPSASRCRSAGIFQPEYLIDQWLGSRGLKKLSTRLKSSLAFLRSSRKLLGSPKISAGRRSEDSRPRWLPQVTKRPPLPAPRVICGKPILTPGTPLPMEISFEFTDAARSFTIGPGLLSVGDRQWLRSEVGRCRRGREFGQLSERTQEQLPRLVSRISKCVKGKTHFDGCLCRIGAPALTI